MVWKELMSRFISSKLDDLTFIEYEKNKDNLFHQELMIPRDCVVMRHPAWLLYERYRDVRMSLDEPYIFHSSYFRLSKDKNAVNITTVHDFTYEFAYKNRMGSFLHFWQRNRAIRKSDAVVCISESTKRDLMKYLPDVPEEKLYVIYNAVSKDYCRIRNEEKIQRLKDYILFVGKRDDYKNGEWLAECIKDSDYKILFCGRDMTEKERLYYDTVLGKGRYELKVDPSNEELNRYYNSVKCLVYPSSYEGFGIPVLEAQNAGCPVIACNTSSIPEVIGNTPLLLKELTSEELFRKLKMLSNDDLKKLVVEEGVENAKRFSWDKAYEEYEAVYNGLISSRKAVLGEAVRKHNVS